MSRSTALVFELWGFNYTSYSYNDDVYDEGGWTGTSYNTREKVTNTLIYGGPGVRLLRKKTKKRLFGFGKQNNYAGSNVIDFQIFFLHTDGETIGPLPMIGASKRF